MRITLAAEDMLPPAWHPIEKVRTEFHPHQSEDGIIERLYACEFTASFMNAFQFWRLPHLAPHLWFALPSGGGPGRLFVSGPTLRPVLATHGPRVLHITGVQLSPGILGSLLSSPATLLVEQSLPLSTFWGEEVAPLEDALSRESEPRKRCERLLEAIQVQARHRVQRRTSRLVQNAIAQIQEGTPSVEGLADSLDISSRHLNRLFGHQVGCSPKQAMRVVRLAKVLAALGQGKKVEWSDLAAAQGFSDQSHLISDFRDLMGETPKRFVTNHGPGLRYSNLGWLLSPNSPPLPRSVMIPTRI